MSSLLTYLLAQFQRSARLFWIVAKIMVPVMVVVQVADSLGIVHWLGELIAPAMQWLNLPPEAGLIWATTALTGIMGGVATISALGGSLEMTSAQLSALAAMMLFSHALPVEQAIVKRAGASMAITTALRVVTAIVYAAIVMWVCTRLNLLNDPVSFDWLRGSDLLGEHAEGFLGQVAAGVFSLLVMFAITVALVLLLDVMDRVGLTRHFTTLTMPVLRLSGLTPNVAPVTTVGVLLGLTYGGALIIEASRTQKLDKRTRLLSLSWLSLSHSLIEDTLLLMALGANIWVVLVGRLIITLLVVMAMAWLTRHWQSDVAVREAA